MSKLLPVSLALRAVQFLCGIVILALAVTLITGHKIGSAPVTTKYSAFTGGFGLFTALVGVGSLYVEFIPNLVALALDGLSGALYLGGGIAWAIALRSTNGCKDLEEMVNNGAINFGKKKTGGGTLYGVEIGAKNEKEAIDKLKDNCTKGLADESLQFISVAVAIGLVFIGWVVLKRGGTLGKKGSYV
ncbi:marvel domain-containing protein [Podospora fimiseda]|uniref:Marvel domain-containing protein n=1 Tax=Podospora fimiseda TaxID=252190 RepID=A0AAN7H5S3_9PEZI|nr:marvel domain-containing protein [Podospora fimiseda]